MGNIVYILCELVSGCRVGRRRGECVVQTGSAGTGEVCPAGGEGGYLVRHRVGIRTVFRFKIFPSFYIHGTFVVQLNIRPIDLMVIHLSRGLSYT